MSVVEIKQKVLALPESERHEFILWAQRLESPYGDVSGEALDRLAASVWDEDDHYAPPTHPTK
jgi:hypothetical protein